MAEVRQLELDLWTALKNASDDPIAAEFGLVWQALDGLLPGLSVGEQLETASKAIVQITDIFQVQAGLIFEGLDATATMNGPTMAADAFDRYVRQSMEIDFDDYIEAIEPLERLPRTVRSIEDEFYSQVQSIDKTTLLETLHEEIVLTDAEVQESAMSVAHGEDITEWIETIREQLQRFDRPIELQQLLNQVSLRLVELWLGLLLGGYGLSRSAESKDFYSLVGLWVKL
jgi:hypothetical protein